jgi:hypothetical protein
MSLVAFHRVLILVAIAFCLGFAGWELRAWMSSGSGLVMAAVFAALAAALTVYLIRLRSILRLED